MRDEAEDRAQYEANQAADFEAEARASEDATAIADLEAKEQAEIDEAIKKRRSM